MENTDHSAPPHIPVLLDPIFAAIRPVKGAWIDGTFGNGGYSRAFLDAGADCVIGIDRDPSVFNLAADWARDYGDKLVLIPGVFGDLDRLAQEAGFEGVDGVVLDIGVSSMQIDQAERGFSFQKDGPLDMRMSGSGLTAADIVNRADEDVIADVLFQYGEERASRRIARAIGKARAIAPIKTTAELSKVIESVMPRPKPGQVHPATRSFQALRIAVNDELGQLVAGLAAAEAILRPEGVLAVVTFHSLEDRIVKRFFQARSGSAPKSNRYAPEQVADAARFDLMSRKAIVGSEDEIAANPRARSAKLRVARRTAVPSGPIDTGSIGLPKFDQSRLVS